MNQDRRTRPGRGPAPAATANPLCPGELVWLTPRTIGAPTVAYKQPQVRVVEVAPLSAEVTVELPDGARLTTSSANIRRSQPCPPAAPRPRVGRRPALELAPGEQEVPLWDF
jgi:hypothetical protein